MSIGERQQGITHNGLQLGVSAVCTKLIRIIKLKILQK